MLKTKIVCTLGPATDNDELLRNIIIEGMGIARFNFSHGTHDEHLIRINLIKQLRDDLNKPIALLMDIKGPDIRIGKFSQSPIELSNGQQFTLTGREVVGSNKIISISFQNLALEVRVGDRILIDDGLVELITEEISGLDILCRVITGGEIGNNKSLNIPGTRLNLPFISKVDRSNIEFAIANDFDYIAASFTRSAHDINELRFLIEQLGGRNLCIIAKIENQEGVDNIDEIIRVCDGIMVARGDMGVEVPFEELPHIQKEIIKKCNHAGKPVITATQMLDSMIRNPRPTRAEITDVANAIYDGTSAVMLSGETSIGKYPIDAVKTIVRIAAETEKNILASDSSVRAHYFRRDITQAIGFATCETAQTLGASAIITVTKSGHSARMVSKYHPEAPILAITTSKQVYHQLALVHGVYSLFAEIQKTTDDMFTQAITKASETGMLKNGDLVIITGGMITDTSGTTNVLKVHLIGDILASGIGNNEPAATGSLCVISNDDDINYFTTGNVLVIKKYSDQIAKLIRNARAIITEEDPLDSKAMAIGTTMGIPVVSGIGNAVEFFKSGSVVTVEGKTGNIRSGVKK